MVQAYVGEIRVIAGGYAPQGWALCNGALQNIHENGPLFAVLGVTYGGDGVTTFALPDLRGRTPLQAGTGAGLTPRALGEAGGQAAVQLVPAELPVHGHVPGAVSATGTLKSPSNALWAGSGGGKGGGSPTYQAEVTTPMSPTAVLSVGSGMPHNNLQPFLALNFIICLHGQWPGPDA